MRGIQPVEGRGTILDGFAHRQLRQVHATPAAVGVAQAHSGLDHVEGVAREFDVQALEPGFLMDPARRRLDLQVRALDELPVAARVEERGRALDADGGERPGVELDLAAAGAGNGAQPIDRCQRGAQGQRRLPAVGRVQPVADACGEHVAQAQCIERAHAQLGAVLAGAVGAVVAQAGGDFIGAFTVAGDQDDVGLAFVLARLQHRGDRHPGQVACVEKGAFQLRLAQRAADQA